ncbi:fasciclin domain-containing protein [Robiginitalea sp. IMCC44478]|uniref:fasciclin domain-containing protein n=1 Tax=Robiginitalea sp. IMCC44478 TaxID=3459122 RepID=UPI004041DF7F
MKILKTSMTLALAGMLSLACAQEKKKSADDAAADMAEQSEMATEAVTEAPPTIAGVASGNEAFSTLVAALGAADLVATLDGEGPFTVFAPTNDAFGKLPEGTVETLLKPENKGTLTGILTYHVISGKYMAADVVKAIQDNNNAFPVETVQGGSITLSLKDGSVILTDVAGNTSNVTMTDVEASNGVIHVIDTVVMPE